MSRYRQSVLTAVAEVEDSLAGLRLLAQQAGEIDQALPRRAVRPRSHRSYMTLAAPAIGAAGHPAQPGERGAQRRAVAGRPCGRDGVPDPYAGRLEFAAAAGLANAGLAAR